MCLLRECSPRSLPLSFAGERTKLTPPPSVFFTKWRQASEFEGTVVRHDFWEAKEGQEHQTQDSGVNLVSRKDSRTTGSVTAERFQTLSHKIEREADKNTNAKSSPLRATPRSKRCVSNSSFSPSLPSS